MGQVRTPAPIAALMAREVDSPPESVVALDPGSGEGELSVALVQELISRGCKNIHLELYEIDSALAAKCEAKMQELGQLAAKANASFSFVVRASDFIDARWTDAQYDLGREGGYDIVIMNPPYYKLRKDSFHSRLAGALIHGQPNIYGLFLSLGSRLLRPKGEFIAITPRSWFSGSYFATIRTDVLSRLDLDRVHTFANRDEAFGAAGVLQETVVFHATRANIPTRPDVVISVYRRAAPLDSPATFVVPWKTLCPSQVSEGVRLPESVYQLAALSTLDEDPLRLKDIDLDVTTGPVVPFRATEYLSHDGDGPNYVPLIWPSHVTPNGLRWSPEAPRAQPAFIRQTPESRGLLFPNEEMVLVRRFSAKEDRRRVVACHLPSGVLGKTVGVENHVNVIRGFSGPKGPLLAEALTAYLNSELVDQYLRAVSGTTQINAAELRRLPVPSRGDLLSLVKERMVSVPW